MLYLILHKVRGEPAYDIATPVLIGQEEGWIVPTSGHRCYPYKKWCLEDLSDISDVTANGYHDAPWLHDTVPEDWPDHYPDSLTTLGLRAKQLVDSKKVTIDDLLI